MKLPEFSKGHQVPFRQIVPDCLHGS